MVKSENVKTLKKIIFTILFVFIFCALTRIFTLDELGIKLLFSYSVPILLSIFILRLSIPLSVFYMGVGSLLLSLSESITLQIGILLHSSPGQGNSIPIIHTVVSKIIYIMLIITMQKIISDCTQKKFKWKELLFFVFSNVGYMIVAICILANVIYVHHTVYTNVFLICSFVILFALIVNILFSEKYLKLESKEKEHELAIYELEVQTRYYEEKMKEEERIKKIYHDMKNHLLIMEKINEGNSEGTKEIAGIKKDLLRYEDYFRTGNKFLDIILKDKVDKAKREDIYIEENIYLGEINFIEAFDISTIFGNLLDNAIDACKLIQNKNDRKVYISAKQENNFLAISVKNNKSNNKNVNNLRKVISGYGLINVANAVNKYDGGIDINEQENLFIVNIIIPIKGEERGKYEENNIRTSK